MLKSILIILSLCISAFAVEIEIDQVESRYDRYTVKSSYMINGDEVSVRLCYEVFSAVDDAGIFICDFTKDIFIEGISYDPELGEIVFQKEAPDKKVVCANVFKKRRFYRNYLKIVPTDLCEIRTIVSRDYSSKFIYTSSFLTR